MVRHANNKSGLAYFFPFPTTAIDPLNYSHNYSCALISAQVNLGGVKASDLNMKAHDLLKMTCSFALVIVKAL